VQLNPRYGDEPFVTVDRAVLAATVGDPAAVMVQQRRRLAGTLSGLDDSQWAARSRCADWSVQDVVAHLVGTNQFWALSIGAARNGEPTRVLAGFDPVTTPARMVDGMRTLPPSAILEQFVATNDAMAAVVADLDDRAWDLVAEAPPGHVPLAVVLLHALWDAWVHERDVLLPLGLTPVEDDREVAGSVLYAAALSPGFVAMSGSTRRGAIEVRAALPAARFVIEVSDVVAIHGGDAPSDALVLTGDAVPLAEALSLRAPLDQEISDEHRWLMGGLAAAFDVAV